MNDRLLRGFYNDKQTKEEVFTFFMLCARELAADKALKGEPTAGFKEVFDILGYAMQQLDEMYEVAPVKHKGNSAR